MENTPALTPEQVIERKRNGFANYAVESHNVLLSLQTRANKALETAAKLPTSIDQILEAEATLKELKKEQTAIETDRKGQSSKLDKFFENLMAPEKAVKAAIPAYESAIIKLKQEKKTADSAAENKANEFKRIKEQFAIHINNSKAGFENLITDTVNIQYAYALKNFKDAETIKAGENELSLIDYLFKCQGKILEAGFVIGQPAVTANYHTIEDLGLIWRDVAMDQVSYLDGKLFKGKFDNAVNDKFRHFAVAVKDAERAIEASNKQAETAKAEAQQTAQQENIGAKLQANAVVLDDTPVVKDLKQKFEIDMPDTQESAMKIMAAFVGNIQKTASEVRGKWSTLSVGQMGEKLAAVKNKDNAFTVTGIVFKAVEKL